ncbi:MAG: T9SS type A sorting domain-containing protein [Bacteroidota bacterium]
MKKIFTILASFILLGSNIAFSQCTPNTSITQPGIFPDSATGLTPAVMNQPYTQIMQMRVPVDTVVSIGPLPVTVPIVSIELMSFTGLPAGLSYSCNPASCVYPGGSNGCVAITGTPTVSGHFPLIAVTKTIATVFGVPTPQYDTLTYYYLDVTTSAGLSESGVPTLSMSQNMPNPTEDFTSIIYNLPSTSEVEFYMHNMIGKEVYHRTYNGDQGENVIKLDVRDFTPGVYMYSISVNGESITKRMVISKK